MNKKIDRIYLIGLLLIIPLSVCLYYYLPESVGFFVFVSFLFFAIAFSLWRYLSKRNGKISLRKAWKAVADLFWGI